jgi:bifunctional NMN adenylyltransferase/nudix hydrolase
MDFDYLVFIGRFEPFHNGHKRVADCALERAQRLVVVIGSAGRPRTIRNPWTAAERAEMIRAALAAHADRLALTTVGDHPYNENAWICEVQQRVADAVRATGGDDASRIGLIGRDKDHTSYYLREFPQWPLVDVQRAEALSATEMRHHLFTGDAGGRVLLKANVPAPVFDVLEAFRAGSPAYARLVEEYAFIRKYRAAWAGAPHPPVFVTVDAVVVHSGHVLLVRRGAAPGKGLWALPGGFVEQDETLETAVLRELKEETRLKLPVPVLRGALQGRAVFDAPDRSLRGRTITHAFHFAFPSGELPAVKGGSDASRAQWVRLAEALAMGEQFFEDHLDIVRHFVGAG